METEANKDTSRTENRTYMWQLNIAETLNQFSCEIECVKSHTNAQG